MLDVSMAFNVGFSHFVNNKTILETIFEIENFNDSCEVQYRKLISIHIVINVASDSLWKQ